MEALLKSLYLLIVNCLLFSPEIATAQAQQVPTADKIIFLDGNVKEGKITAFIDDQVQFSYKGETLRYEFTKASIEKIAYASGRTETLNQRKVTDCNLLTGVKRNSVAVLPLNYSGENDYSREGDMRYKLQEIVAAFLSKSATTLSLQDPASTNAVLLKAGITDYNVRQYTPAELASVLGVEYVIMGSVLQSTSNIRTVSAGHSRGRTWVDNYGRNFVVKERNNNIAVSNTVRDMRTEVSISIYSNSGENIYSNSRRSILSDQDAYRAALHYLLKRTPLYKK